MVYSHLCIETNISSEETIERLVKEFSCGITEMVRLDWILSSS